MIEPLSFCHNGNCYYPVWQELDGTEWAAYAVWECCEHIDNPSRLQAYLEDPNAPWPGDCGNPVDYAGGGRQLCKRHFEKEVKIRSRVRWALFER